MPGVKNTADTSVMLFTGLLQKERKAMELLQLRYFCLVAERGSITRAAEELLISQPSLSKTIKKLEQEVGVLLFDRSPGKITLNQYGKIFYDSIQRGLMNIDDGLRKVSDMSEQNMHVTLLASAATGILADLFFSFQTAHPGILLTVERLQHNLQHPTIFYDIAISESIGVPSGHTSIPLFTEQLGIVVPAGHPLSTLSSLKIIQTRPYGFVTYPKGRNTRTHLDNLCAAAGFSPTIFYEIDHTSMYRGCMNKGLSLLSFSSYYCQYRDTVKFVPITDPGSTRTLCISWDATKYLSSVAKIFRAHCIDYFHAWEKKQQQFLQNLEEIKK